jgi:hypothetical protein
MGSEAAPVAGWSHDASESDHPRRRRRRPVPWFRVFLALVVVGGLAWASLSPGGLRARLSGVDSSISGTVADLTQSRSVDQASKMFNAWYAQQGSYPNYTQSQLDEMGNADWSEGMNVSWCTPRDVVLSAFTASGTVSRLLIDGKVIGNVDGHVACPADLDDPVPWKLPS